MTVSRRASASPTRRKTGSTAENTDKLGTTAFPKTTTEELKKMFDRYSRNGRAQSVSFRRLVSWIKVGERATHYVHSYPAKLLPHIAHFFLAASQLSGPGDVVLDPFGGTGTVAVEALLSGKRAYLAEVNPLARLIARVKTGSLPQDDLAKAIEIIKKRRKQYAKRKHADPDVVNLRSWYADRTIAELSALKSAILAESAGVIQDFLLICFSQTCRKCSNSDPRLSVPVRRKAALILESDEVWKIFDHQVSANIDRFEEFLGHFKSKSPQYRTRFVGHDARSLRAPSSTSSQSRAPLKSNSVNLIITSPPYAGAQKYIRASSLSLGWLGLAPTNELKKLDNASIGREHFPKASCRTCPKSPLSSAENLFKRIFRINPLRAVIVATYLDDMTRCVSEMARVLVPGGYLVLVIGNNQVCGLTFKSSTFLQELAENYGLKTKLRLIDEIRSRGLMTKRNKTAGVITREWVLVFQKPEHKRSAAKPSHS
jgi:tRNA G10  N-methylase Trm11